MSRKLGIPGTEAAQERAFGKVGLKKPKKKSDRKKAWMATRLLTKAFRLGPALLLPIVYLWANTCYRIGSGEAHDWWRVYPFAVVMVAALLWHLALIVVGKDKLYYAMYAFWHFPVFLSAIFFACMYATRAAWL